MLKGVSVARRIWLKPPALITFRSFASPACAPSAAPTFAGLGRQREFNHDTHVLSSPFLLILASICAEVQT
jgi:hypothetical protein